MKIVYKIFFFTMLLIIFTITFGIFSNKQFLNEYYLKNKQKDLISIAETLDTKKLAPVERKSIELNDEISYNFIPRRLLDNSSNRTLKRAFTYKNYEFEILKFRRGPSMLKLVVRKTPEGQYALLTTLDQVQKAVEISNKFYIYVGIISLIISIPFVMIFSKYLSTKISLINNNIKEIIGLNFSKKLDLQSRDEFGETANNLNLLSQTLENNLQNLKNMNNQLQIDIDFERKKEQYTRNFITAITHELKTPITIMNTHAEYIAGGYTDGKEDLQEYANEIMNEGQHMSGLIDKLLTLLKSSSLLDTVKFEDFDLKTFVDSIVSRYNVDLEEKKVSLIIDIKKPSIVNSNKSLLKQVFDNLISNAVSFVPSDGTGEIKIISYNKNDFITIEIINNGPTIPENLIDKVWDPFFKEEASRNRKYGGTGLGLAIVKGVLERLGGSCGVVNLENGVKFWFDIKKV